MSHSNAAPDATRRTDTESENEIESESEDGHETESERETEKENESTSAGVGDQFDRQAMKWDFDIPDATTIHETPATNESSSADDTDSTGAKKHPHKDVAYYACPFCSYTDLSERVVRAHITKVETAGHTNRNAFVDRLFVQAMAADDTIVEDVAPPAEGGTRYTGDDSMMFIPEGVDPDTQSRTAEILDAAVKAPMASQADLSDAIYDDRTRGASQISTAIQRYLDMDGDGDGQDGTGAGTETNEDRSERTSPSDADTTASATGANRDRRLEAVEFYERTEKQRRVILAWLDDPDPDRTRAEIAAAAGVSETYVPVVREDYDWLITQLQAELDAESMSFEKIVACAELTQPEELTLSSIENPLVDGTVSASESDPESEIEPEPETVPNTDTDTTVSAEATGDADTDIDDPKPELQPRSSEKSDAVTMTVPPMQTDAVQIELTGGTVTITIEQGGGSVCTKE